MELINEKNQISNTNINSPLESNDNYFSSQVLIASKLIKENKFKEAEDIYREIILSNYHDPYVYHNLALLCSMKGQESESIKLLNQALKLKPNYVKAHVFLANLLKDKGDLEAAIESYNIAISYNHSCYEAHVNIANIHYDNRDFNSAIESYNIALSFKPGCLVSLLHLGNINKNKGDLDSAIGYYEQAISYKEDYFEAYNNLGNVYKDKGDFDFAIRFYKQAICINESDPLLWNNLGNAYNDLGKFNEAEISLLKAIELQPELAEAYNNLANTLIAFGKYNEAEQYLYKAVQIKKDYADAYFNLSFLQLHRGDYDLGLKNYEFRFKKKNPVYLHGEPKTTRMDQQILSSEDKVLIVSEQGLGDTIQYMRYIPCLKDLGLNVSFCAHPKLHSLIRVSNIISNPIAPDQINMVSEAKWIPLLSLPKYLEVSPSNPIVDKTYIYTTVELENKWRNIFSKERRPIIGINWQGNPSTETQSLKGRSIPLEFFSKLGEKTNLNFVSLQKGFGSEQLETCSFNKKFISCQDKVEAIWDFVEIAAIISNCDLIITSDTSVAHLAGGMGKKTWLLLHYLPDWRWGLNSNRTFWYPSMKLFRQSERDNWIEVMERVSLELKLLFFK